MNNTPDEHEHETMLCPACNAVMVHGGRDDYGGDMDAVCDHYWCEKCDYTTEQNCIEDWEYDDYDDNFDPGGDYGDFEEMDEYFDGGEE